MLNPKPPGSEVHCKLQGPNPIQGSTAPSVQHQVPGRALPQLHATPRLSSISNFKIDSASVTPVKTNVTCCVICAIFQLRSRVAHKARGMEQT